MTAKILFVDDEIRILQALHRTMRREFDISIAESGRRALEMLAEQPFAVVVSDMRMPQMNGLELLTEVRKQWPETTRMMLTGNNDQETAIQAVNCGEVFRFLNKPCEAEVLRRALQAGIRQYELTTAEKDLLEQTLRGSILAMSEILAISKPEIFGTTSRIRKRVAQLCEEMALEDAWQLDTAAMLCQLGCVNLDAGTIRKAIEGGQLTKEEAKSFDAHPLLGAELISKVPRLDTVANIIRYQNKNYDGSGVPGADGTKGDSIPVGARVLRVAIEFDRLCGAKWSEPAALDELRKARGKFDPAVLAAMNKVIQHQEKAITRRIGVGALVDGMIIEENVTTEGGVLLVCAGQPVTPVIRQRLQSFVAAGALDAQILVAETPDDDNATA